MYAIVRTGGKQHKVWYSDVIYIEKLVTEQDATIEFKVAAPGGEGGLKAGAPFVKGASVTDKVLKNDKQRRVTVFTYKSKKSSKREMGHRQSYTKVQIKAINA